jgi:hypothetical protein
MGNKFIGPGSHHDSGPGESLHESWQPCDMIGMGVAGDKVIRGNAQGVQLGNYTINSPGNTRLKQGRLVLACDKKEIEKIIAQHPYMGSDFHGEFFLGNRVGFHGTLYLQWVNG